MRAALVTHPLNAVALLREVASPDRGATALFVGTVRSVNEGREVRAIEYTAYEAMAQLEMARILDEAGQRNGGAFLVAEHRLGLLDVETTLLPEKTTTETEAIHALTGSYIKAYQIHLGQTTGPDCARLFAQTPDGPEGAMSPDGRVIGTYLHGCFAQDEFRHKFLSQLGKGITNYAYEKTMEDTLDALAAHLEKHLDLDKILELAEPLK